MAIFLKESEQNMFRKRDIELIILEVLDCQDEYDKRSIQYLKKNDEAFSWEDLGRYQNLAATLPSQLKLDFPSELPKKLFVRRLNRLIFGREDIAEPEKFVPGKKEIRQEDREEKIAESNIDWDSFSVSNLNSEKLSGFEEVKARTTSIKKVPRELDNVEEVFREKDFSDFTEVSHSHTIKQQKKSSIFGKLVLTAAALFVIIVSISVFMIFNTDTKVVQVTEKKPTVKTVAADSDEFSNDITDFLQPDIQTDEIIQPTSPETGVQKIETSEKSENKINNLPKAPPKLPDPIEAPLITTQEIVNKEETIIEEEYSVPPPKEEIDENEEPTFFVAVEEMPQPIGGLQEIQKKIKYPEIAKRAGVEGKVFVRAFVDENGNVVNAEVVKGIGAGCDEAALDAILKTKFTPGKQRGKPIKVQVTVPVLFKL